MRKKVKLFRDDSLFIESVRIAFGNFMISMANVLSHFPGEFLIIFCQINLTFYIKMIL